jgi:hypothetical protein
MRKLCTAKLLAAAILVLVPLCGTAEATTITGTIKKPDGTLLNGTIEFSLSQGAQVISPPVFFVNFPIRCAVTNGAITSCILQGNDTISPAGTFYKTRVLDSNGRVLYGPQNYTISGASADWGSLPVTATATLVPPTGSVTGNMNVTGNLTVGGTLTAPTINQQMLDLTNQATPPGTPTGGHTSLYSKTDKKVYFKDDTGAEGAIPGTAIANTWSAGQTFTGALNSNNLAAGNVANKYGTADAYRYVSSLGSDSNDGLSAGTAFATPQKCNTVVVALGGGTCDARTLFTYTTSTEIDVGNPSPPQAIVTLLLPPYGIWTGTMTGGTLSILKVFNFGAVIGTSAGQGNQFVIQTNASASVVDVCGTEPASIGIYIRMEGFLCQSQSGATVSGAVLHIQHLLDISRITDLSSAASSTNTKSLYIHAVCCGASVQRVKGNGNNIAGNVPCTIGGTGTDQNQGADIGPISCTNAGSGKNAIAMIQGAGQAGSRIHDIYTEMNLASDTSTPVIGMTGSSGLVDVIDTFHLGADAAAGASTRYMLDIATNSSVIVRNLQVGGSGNAINDHNAGRVPLQPGPSFVVTDYSTENACCGLASYFLKTVTTQSARASQQISDQGTACTNGELALSAGWGTTATVTAVAGTGQTCKWTITSAGTGQAANPTVTDTLTNPLPTATTVCEMRMTGGTGTATLFDQTTLSATVPVFTFQGTPVATSTYITLRRCGP